MIKGLLFYKVSINTPKKMVTILKSSGVIGKKVLILEAIVPYLLLLQIKAPLTI